MLPQWFKTTHFIVPSLISGGVFYEMQKMEWETFLPEERLVALVG